jgi:hypothetical protein
LEIFFVKDQVQGQGRWIGQQAALNSASSARRPVVRAAISSANMELRHEH